MPRTLARLAFASPLCLLVTLAACGSDSASPPPNVDAPRPGPDSGAPPSPNGGTVDAGAASDAAPDAPSSSRGTCADTFGSALTPGFARIDGTVVAVVTPADRQCAFPNNDHVVVQVRMNGDVYRMVVNVESDRAGQDPQVRFAAVEAALPAPAWEEGWHTGVALDYPTTLGVHNAAFTPMAMNDLVTKVASEITAGEPISVYATNGAGKPESAHLVHRNGNNADGAIVVSPKGATPRFLLFHFVNQSF